MHVFNYEKGDEDTETAKPTKSSIKAINNVTHFRH